MFNVLSMAVEQFLLSLIIGGMIILVICVRPLLLKQLARKDQKEVHSLIEEISINSWNRYNKVAFVAITIILVLDIMQFIIEKNLSYWNLVLEVIVLLLFLLKLIVDKSLIKRLSQYGNDAVHSSEQKSEHRLMELVSIVILLLAIILLFLQ